jgi:hypothetical protein
MRASDGREEEGNFYPSEQMLKRLIFAHSAHYAGTRAVET